MRPLLVTLALMAHGLPVPAAPADPAPAPAEANLASYAMGAWIVKRPGEYDETWSSHWLLDERPTRGGRRAKAERLATQGFGATRPVGGNDTGMGRAQNRRVELARAGSS